MLVVTVVLWALQYLHGWKFITVHHEMDSGRWRRFRTGRRKQIRVQYMQEDKQRMSSRRTSRIRKTSLHWLLLYKTCPFEKIPCVLRSNLEGTFIYGGMVEFSGLYRLDPNAVVLVKRKVRHLIWTHAQWRHSRCSAPALLIVFAYSIIFRENPTDLCCTYKASGYIAVSKICDCFTPRFRHCKDHCGRLWLQNLTLL